MFGAVQEKYHTNQEKQVIISRDHVFGAKINEWAYGRPIDSLHEIGIRSFDSVTKGDDRQQTK
jgi:hypothetical protein